MFGKIDAALLHFDEEDRLPDEIGEGGAAAVLLDAVLAGGASFLEAGMAEGAEQVIEEKLRLALFVAGEMGGAPVNEGLQSGFAFGHVGAVGAHAECMAGDYSVRLVEVRALI